MAEETRKASENKITIEDVTDQPASAGEGVKLLPLSPEQIAEYIHSLSTFDVGVEAWITIREALLPPHLSARTRILNPVLNNPKLALAALAAGGTAESETSGEETQRREAIDEVVTKALINSAIADVERAREVMQRDDEEIQRLKQETRAILTKLAA